MLKQYFQSPEFKKLTRNTADSGIKLIFKWGAWGIIAIKNFLTDIIKMGFGIKK